MRNDLREGVIDFLEQHPSADALVDLFRKARSAFGAVIATARRIPPRSRAAHAGLPRVLPATGHIRAWWSPAARDRNFGDQLTPYLLRRDGLHLERVPAADAQLLCAGSILDKVPLGWSGIVFGAGLMFERSRCDLRAATVLGVRGPLTAERCGIGPDVPLFDPTLLLDPPAIRGSLVGVIAHYADRHLARRVRADLVIDVTAGVENVIEAVARCAMIHTSSLHGAILADTFGIPRVVHLSPANRGGGFKFRDWDAAIAQRGIARMRDDARSALYRLRELCA